MQSDLSTLVSVESERGPLSMHRAQDVLCAQAVAQALNEATVHVHVNDCYLNDIYVQVPNRSDTASIAEPFASQ